MGTRSRGDVRRRTPQWVRAEGAIAELRSRRCARAPRRCQCNVYRRGLFAEAIAAAMPDLPMIDEESLEDPAARADFIQRVREFEAGIARTNK